MAIASTFLSHNFAWAVCSDGSTLPAEGFTIGLPPVVNADNWSPDVFTGTTGSIWVPDTSVNENNDPSKPLTGGGHNWVFDQGSTLCKVTDEGPAGSLPTGWSIPPNNPTDCVILPVIVQGRVTNFGDIPYQGDAITPTCDPTQYVNSDPITGPAQPTNTYFNHLGCSISHGVATTPQTATTYLFVAGIKGGLFSIPLDNTDNPVVGGEAGKGVTGQNYYSQIPSGSFLTNAAVSKDGQFAIATSIRRDLRVWGCFNPLGDPGDPTLSINPDFFIPPGSEVPCMEVGSNNLAVDLTTAFGPDNQPYFGGRRVVNTFNSVPGSNDVNNPVTTAWPNCIWQNNGAASLADAFNNNFQNGCGSAQPNFAMLAALITQPSALISHGKYMYTGPLGGTIYQFLVKVNPLTGLSEYKFRTYVSGLSIVTGLGTDDALQSLFVFTDPTAIGLAAREFVTKLPLCEDMDGEVVTASGATGGGGIAGAGNAAAGAGGPAITLTGAGAPVFSAAGGAAATTPNAGTAGTTTGVGGFIVPGVGGGVAAAGAAGFAATAPDPATTAAGTVSTPVAPRAAAATSTPRTATGPITPSTPPTGNTGADAATTPGVGFIAIGGSSGGIPASGVITGPTFSVKVVPNAAK